MGKTFMRSRIVRPVVVTAQPKPIGMKANKAHHPPPSTTFSSPTTKEEWRRVIQSTRKRTTRYLGSKRIRSQILIALLPLLAISYSIYSIILLHRWRRRRPTKQHPSSANDLLHPFFPDPPRSFVPLPDDNTGLPNVVYGCNTTTTTTTTARQVDEIQLHVMGWKRHESLQTLLEQLQNADYNGWSIDVPIYIHIDGGGPPETVNVVKNNFNWTHGPQYVNIQPTNLGLRTMWLDSLGPAARKAGNNTLLVVFEDDVRVSSAFFQWLLVTIDAYAHNRNCRDSNLVGFSLSPICVQEMRKPFKRWDARDALGKRNNNDYRHLAYLTVVPSSWGAAYWSDQWNEFDKFVRKRMQPPFYDMAAENVPDIRDYGELRMTPEKLHIPGARSNVWPKSWKRFMVDFMYARGLVMLYPNLPGQQGLATALQESGEHVSTVSKRLNKNPRVVELLDYLDLPVLGNLPRYGDLAVFGLTLLPTTRERLAAEGAKFLNAVAEKCDDDCAELLHLWARPGSNLANVDKAIEIDNDDIRIPRICAADLYTPASAAQKRPIPSSSTSERFLLLEPQYGANNQLHAIIEAYYWARALGRRLILPPVFMPRVSAFNDESSSSKIENFWKISDADKPDLFQSNKNVDFDGPALDPISFDDFVSTTTARPWRLLRATRSAIFDDSSRIVTKALGKENIPLINLRHLLEKPVTIERLQHLLGGCDDEVLAFDGLYFANLVGVNPREVMPDVMTLSQEAEELYKSVKNKFVEKLGTPDYACYHVRLGDFVSMCDTLENADTSSGISESYLRTVHEFSCSVTPEELTVAIRQNGYPAFVMSDNPQELGTTLAGLDRTTLTSDWTAQAVRESLQREINSSDMELFTLLIDEELCADASFAMLNRFSTVSQRVISLRRGENYQYWKRADAVVID